jgi:cobalamin biosynthetic protein CobC
MTLTRKTGRDHGGNLDAARARFGGEVRDWIDLSTGSNPLPYPVPDITSDAWAVLPRKSDMAALTQAAQRAYGTKHPTVAFAGAQGAIQAVPFLRPAGRARVLAPTYNEHAAALRMAGWEVTEVSETGNLAGADLAVVVNPNNPDGNSYAPDQLRDLATRVGLLIVDESFADTESNLTLAQDPAPNMVILRSFGKFYGLAGLRLGFAIAQPDLADKLREIAGPWPVSGPAIQIACKALDDRDWQETTITRLQRDAQRLDQMAKRAGWRLVGGTPLFRTYETSDAQVAQDALARAHIWSRIFPYSPTWIRLGLAGAEPEWQRMQEVFQNGLR